MRPPSEPQTTDQTAHVTFFLFPRKPVACDVCNYCLLFLEGRLLDQSAGLSSQKYPTSREEKVCCGPTVHRAL